MAYNLDLKSFDDYNNLAIQLLINNDVNLELAQKELFQIIPSWRADCLVLNYLLTENYIQLEKNHNEKIKKV